MNALSLNKQATRVQAMRIANTLARFEIGTTASKVSRMVGSDSIKGIDRHAPHIEKWPFVDLDPLLGEVADILIDDGARATWPLDFAHALPAPDSQDGTLNWQICYARSLNPVEARKDGCRLFAPKMLAIETVKFIDGRWDWGSARIARFGKGWVDALRGPVSSRKDMLGFRDGNHRPIDPLYGDVVAGIALRHRYEWSTIFSFPTGLNLRFGTTAAGALSIFRDREKGESGRRSPVLHWVRQHWRRGTTTAETLREVRRHMRGQEQLVWHGIPVTLIPAEYELEQTA